MFHVGELCYAIVQHSGASWYTNCMNEESLPSDYEECPICGWDHEYDWPLLLPAEKEIAMKEHEFAGS